MQVENTEIHTVVSVGTDVNEATPILSQESQEHSITSLQQEAYGEDQNSKEGG